MPNLVGLTQAEAERKSLASRLRYSFVIETNEQSPGEVFKQEPEAGSKIKTGEEIKFWISKTNP
ncbi:PASTA domain protein [compost metagenome]